MSRRTTLLTLTAIGAVMAANSLLLGTRLMFGFAGVPFSEVALTGTHVAYNVVLVALLVAFAQVVPRLGQVTGPQGRGFPNPVLLVVCIGVMLDAATRFGEAFMVPFLGRHAPELLDSTPDRVLMSAMVACWIAYLVGLVTLGVVAFRRRIFPRPAAVLLVVGGLSVPAVGPLSGSLIGVALAWGGCAALRAAPAAPIANVDPAALRSPLPMSPG